VQINAPSTKRNTILLKNRYQRKHNENKTGPRINPCVTPKLRGTGVDKNLI